METHRRRQHRSCDQCRKGKRACDAPVHDTGRRGSILSSASSSHSNVSDSAGPCSNCKRWKKECTFNWLSSVRSTSQAGRTKKRARRTADVPNSTSLSQKRTLNDSLDSGKWLPSDFEAMLSPVDTSDPLRTWSLGETGTISGDLEENLHHPLTVDPFRLPSWDTSVLDVPLAYEGDSSTDQASKDICGSLDYSIISSNSAPNSLDDSFDILLQLEDSSVDLNDELHCSPLGCEQFPGSSNDPFQTSRSRRARLKDWGDFSDLSGSLADKHARSTMAQNLFRIYHDSMENALSCWLTERNCPYSSSLVASSNGRARNRPVNGVEREWGPNWSNRICSRVCQLDRAYSSVRGRNLTATEERVASRTLHASIVAFASQWTQNSQKRTSNFRAVSSGFRNASRASTNEGDIEDFDLDPAGSIQSSVSHIERSMQENLWNEARHVLNESVGIPSFRVVFANIIFSLTQRPLDIQEHIRRLDRRTRSSYNIPDSVPFQPDEKASGDAELHELFDNDCAPTFLETAIRQMFTFRYQLTRRQRQMPKSMKGAKSGFSIWEMSDASPISDQQESGQSEPVLPNPEHYETFNLLFWLGVMFDTLTSAMHQRPPVVSDEDSQVTCVAPSLSHMAPTKSQIDLDGWDVIRDGARNNKQKLDLWGDLFLHKDTAGQGSNNVARWPCSYRDAAETLSDAAPVKVLLFRRVTHLQTLVYRGADPERLEEAIQDTLLVYQHWNTTYRRFILDCVANHDDLPPRVQSWYVILAGHWHLAAMLLADTVESIDQAGIGMARSRESRHAMNLVSTLRRENAMAVGSLARCSLARQDRSSFAKLRQFHDSVNEGAFLTEPWTVVLVRSFTTAGFILLEDVDTSPHAAVHSSVDDPSETSRRQCAFCIDALWCLGRKSDMAFLAARALSNGLDRRLIERLRPIPEYNFPEDGVPIIVPGVYTSGISVPSIDPIFG